MSYEALEWALRDKRVQSEVLGTKRHVLIVLADHANKNSNKAWPGRERVAAEAGLSKSTVDSAFKWLSENGFITAVGYCRRARVYELLINGVSDDASAPVKPSVGPGELNDWLLHELLTSSPPSAREAGTNRNPNQTTHNTNAVEGRW